MSRKYPCPAILGIAYFGMVAGIALNRIFAGNPDMLRFSPGESDRRLEEYLAAEIQATINNKQNNPGKDPRLFKIPETALIEAVAAKVAAALRMLSPDARAGMIEGLAEGSSGR